MYDEYSRVLAPKDPMASVIVTKGSGGDDVLPDAVEEPVTAVKGASANAGVGANSDSKANVVETYVAGGATSPDGANAAKDEDAGETKPVIVESSDPADGLSDRANEGESNGADVMVKEELSCPETVANGDIAECAAVTKPDNAVGENGYLDAGSKTPMSEIVLPTALQTTESESTKETDPFEKTLLDTLLSKVRVALTSSLSKNVFDLGRLISGEVDEQINSQKTGANGMKGNRERCSEEGIDDKYYFPEGGREGVEALTLDPSFLEKENVQLYKLADETLRILDSTTCVTVNSCEEEIIGAIQKGGEMSKNGEGFLSDNSLTAHEGSSLQWPSWMLPFYSKDVVGTNRLSLALLLLAGFDFSINASYQRWLTHRERKFAASHRGKFDVELQPMDSFKSCDRESRLREGLLKMHQVGSLLSSNNSRIITLFSEDDYTKAKQLFHVDTPEIDLYDMIAAPLLRFSSQMGTVNQSWNETIKIIFRNLNENSTAEIISIGEDSIIHEVKLSKSSGCSDVTNSKKGSNRHGGSSSGQKNKDGVTARSAQPASSKKGKKKKKKKVSCALAHSNMYFSKLLVLFSARSYLQIEAQRMQCRQT